MSLNIIPDPFVILQPDGSIYDINESCLNLIGVEKEKLVGNDFRSFDPLKKLSERVTQSIMNSTEDFEHIVHKNRHFEVFILPFSTEGELALIRIVFKDITNFARLEKELIKRNKELMIISTLSSTFISAENLDMAIEDLIEKVLLVSDFSIGWMLLEEKQGLVLKTSRGISPEFQKNISRGLLDTICKDALRKGEPLYIMDPSDMSKMNLLQKEGLLFLVGIPLMSGSHPMGILFLGSRERKENNIDFDMAALMTLVGNTISLIVDKITLFQETKRLSITDSLTGLFNRRYFFKSLENEIARAKRYGNMFSLMLFDIDNFKVINDTYGHQAGDTVLQETANILKSISRETDITVRYGGEEFIILLPNTSEAETISLANRIKNTVQKTKFFIDTSEGVHITLSGGVASYPLNATESEPLLSAADSALYAAKTAGKNKILCYKGTFNEKCIQKTTKP
jgi:diguanylate cyclase (GGDEF)-like protein/PAS domain S-box-containing protein